MPPIVKNSGQKSLEKKGQWGRLYMFPCGFNKLMLYYLFWTVSQTNVHGRQKACTGRVLVPVTSLHSVYGLYIIRHNGTNSLSFSPAVSLLYMHWRHWEHLAQSSFFNMFLILGAHYSIEIQRSITSNYRSPSPGLHRTFTRGLSWLTIYPEEQNPASVNHGIWCEIFC